MVILNREQQLFGKERDSGRDKSSEVVIEPTSDLWLIRLRGEGEINVGRDNERWRSPF